ncbi:2-dehydropantoate 2-reductase N-terminal domain-containing protein [Lentzea sp. NPDC003310]|uniref:ketopantoate reductase family protein n=1 Tax=Lentzea sp. NPDC003310 TaxID=3154447 RepID=UPI0033A9F77B
MKILLFGRGVIATLYGWALEQAGHEVEFYVRPGRAAAYGDVVELDVVDARRRVWGRRVEQRWPVRLREDLPADHDFDLVLVSVSHHRVAEAAAFLAPRLGDATVLVFGNVWADPAAAVAPLPLDRVAWGFPQAGGGFGANGVLRGVIMPSAVFGTLERPPTERERAVRELFRRAGLRVRERSDFRAWLWIHVVSDAGLYSQALPAGSIAALIGRAPALREALLAGRELLPLLEARGLDLRRHRGSTRHLRLPARPVASVMTWLIAHFAPARASFAAHDDPGATEPRELCRDVLAEARRLGVPAPRLEAAEPHFAAVL